MQAIILAAGMGKRLKELTNDNTKCMVKVNGVTMIERMLSQLEKLDLSSITIVVGYKEKELKEFISSLNIRTPLNFVYNSIYNKTNNIYSLYLAREYLKKEDTLLLESDLIFEDSVLQKIINDPYPSLALVAKYESWMDGTVVTIDKENNIKNFFSKKDFNYEDIKHYYKTVNIYKFSKEFSKSHYVPFLEAYCKALGNNEYYEQVLKVITLLEKPEIKATVLEDESWYEIDDVQDLDIAESIFAQSEDDKLIKMQKRYGGYWRYPKIIDFCYLVNPFYPNEKMLDEIKSNLERLICEYPSGLDVNNLLASKYFEVNRNHIVVGNGAAELINGLMKICQGKIGIVVPTFEEYPNRKSEEDIVRFVPNNKDFSYNADDLINYFNDKDIKNLLIINPDNPSGNYIMKEDVLKIANWAQKRKITLVIDESFVDFVDKEVSPSLIDEKIISNYLNLVVIKSISKSYGVPGLRLGVAVSSNEEIIQLLKRNVSIWNINSIAEFYLQIFEKYKNEYTESLKKIIGVRKTFINKLSNIDKIRVIPSQANYIMCQVLAPYTAYNVTKEILSKHNILIKDLSGKSGINGEYIRIAVKTSEENDKIINALKEVFINE